MVLAVPLSVSSERGLLLLLFVVQGRNVMEEQDLREIGITDPSHRRKILHAARSLPKVRVPPCVRKMNSTSCVSLCTPYDLQIMTSRL